MFLKKIEEVLELLLLALLLLIPFLKKKKKISCLIIFPLLFWHLPAAKCLPAVCVLDWSSQSVPEILACQPTERSVPPAAGKNYHLPKR